MESSMSEDKGKGQDELTTIHHRLDEQYKLIVDHIAEDRIQYEQQMKLSNSNLEAIAKLTASTQDVVNAWSTANNLQKFIKWIGGFSLLIAAVTWYIKNF